MSFFGGRPGERPVGPGTYRIQKGDKLAMVYLASAAPTRLEAAVDIMYDDGVTGEIGFGPETSFTTDRSFQSVTGRIGARADGWVVGGGGAAITGAIKRGQFYGNLGTFGSGNRIRFLAQGYLYLGHALPVGENTEPGPGGGEGHLSWQVLASDIAGNVVTTISPALTNALRRIYGYVFFYDADANAASRILTTTFNARGGSLPTGFATGGNADVWEITGPTLTLSEEGTQFVLAMKGKDGIISFDDNGTITYGSTATAPHPFPYDVVESDASSLILSAAAGLAGDRYAAYALIEEWLVA